MAKSGIVVKGVAPVPASVVPPDSIDGGLVTTVNPAPTLNPFLDPGFNLVSYQLASDLPLPDYTVLKGKVLAGTDGVDSLLGALGNDVIGDLPANLTVGLAGAGSAGDDVFMGGAGNDTLYSSQGNDVLIGGSGDDVYIISGVEASVVSVEDFQGHDILDASASQISSIDLSGVNGSSIDGRQVKIGSLTNNTLAKLDVQFLQDLSGSFADDIATVQGLVPGLVNSIQAIQADTQFGVSSFVDKPIGGFGSVGDWVYKTDQALTANNPANPIDQVLANTYANLQIGSGGDEPESQLESLFQLAKHSAEVGFRADAAHFVFLFTDAPFHTAADYRLLDPNVAANNGDAVVDPLENYPEIAQLKLALEQADITPVFAVTPTYSGGDLIAVYQNLVNALGRGSVVEITPNSSNLVAAVQSGLVASTASMIEDAIGGSGADTLIGNLLNNTLTGNAGDDNLDGGAGNDNLLGGDGFDTAIYHGLSTDYNYVLQTDGSYLVTGAEGVDTLFGVEQLQFSDGLFSLNEANSAALSTGLAAFVAAQAANKLASDLAAQTVAESAALANLKNAALVVVNNAAAVAGAAQANASSAQSAANYATAAALEAQSQANAASSALAKVTDTTQQAYIDAKVFADQATKDASLAVNAAAAATVAAGLALTAADNATAALTSITALDIANLTSLDSASIALDTAKLTLVTAQQFATSASTAAGNAIADFNLAHTAVLDASQSNVNAAFALRHIGQTIVGTSLNDTLVGDLGNDIIDGLAGSDTMIGGAGNDTYIADNSKDVVVELANEGIDTVKASTSYSLSANLESLILTGSASNSATGNELDNRLEGNAGNNLINAGAGDDVLIGNAGSDILTGGIGNDTFVFTSLLDSILGKKHDVITDFSGLDKIDLSQMDAIVTTGSTGNDAFHYIGTNAFATNDAGQLRFDAVNHLLSGDVTGDGKADFEIQLTGVNLLDAASIIL